ncbi:hypothetical protein QJS10_CPA05g01516 [Acorus calamus]|uniref:Uncharacterized protein n=1 Tax=Acorus calamus TaxID=4465 RepID=A0AAV9EW64_ACOCL|nr:hypothetical protein QJS10_CPA05g01516 [Acorus calamus]
MGSGTFRFRRLNWLEKDICISLDFYLDACEVLKDIDCFSGPQNDLRYKPNGDYPTVHCFSSLKVCFLDSQLLEAF